MTTATNTNTNARVTMLDEDNMIIDGVNVRTGMPVKYIINALGLIAFGNAFIEWKQKGSTKEFSLFLKAKDNMICLLEEYCKFTEENGKVVVTLNSL